MRLHIGPEVDARHQRHQPQTQQPGSARPHSRQHHQQHKRYQHNHQKAVPAGIVGNMDECSVEHGRQQRCMHFHPGKTGADRCHTQVTQTGRRAADQCNPPLQLCSTELAVQYIRGRNIAEPPAVMPAFAAKRHQNGTMDIGRNAQRGIALPQFQSRQMGQRPRVQTLAPGRKQPDFCLPEHGHEHGQ